MSHLDSVLDYLSLVDYLSIHHLFVKSNNKFVAQGVCLFLIKDFSSFYCSDEKIGNQLTAIKQIRPKRGTLCKWD